MTRNGGYDRKVFQEWRAEKLAKGLCGNCGTRPFRKGRKTCLVCAEANRKARRRYGINKYGLSEDAFRQLSREQGGVCAICHNVQRDARLAIDHDHNTNVVRGLLCTACNVGLGNFKESMLILESAIVYLNSTAEE